jgi:hypothetical protein
MSRFTTGIFLVLIFGLICSGPVALAGSGGEKTPVAGAGLVDPQPQFEVPLVLTDGVITRTIYFGVQPSATLCIASDSFNGHTENFLPPAPPTGSFDTRFVSPRTAQASTCYDQGSLVDFRPFTAAAQLDTFRLRMQSGGGPVFQATWPAGLNLIFTSLSFRYNDGTSNVNVDMLTTTTADFTLAGDPATVNIYSGGLIIPAPIFHATPASIAFGNVQLLSTKRDSITVTNSGGVAIAIGSVTSDNARFSVTPANGTIPPLGSGKFYVTFAPTVAGSASAHIVFTSNALSGSDTVLVNGTGVQGTFTVTPSSVAFDSVLLGNSTAASVLVRNTGTGVLTLNGISSTNSTAFGVAESAPIVLASLDTVRLHLTFHPVTTGMNNGFILITHNGSTGRDSVALSGKGYQNVNVVVPLAAGWNLISNPVTNPVPGDSVRQLYPTSASAYVFAFDVVGGYTQQYRFVNGRGYWGKFPASASSTITGVPRTRDSVTVTAGWNIVGTITSPVDTTGIVSIPAGIRASSWFGYTGGYSPVVQLAPGLAYWVKANAPGKFVLANGPVAAKPAGGHPLQEVLNSVTITDANGASQTLYFGVDGNGDMPVTAYAMPPLPPAGAFDARFATADGGSMLQMHPAAISRALDLPIAMQTDAYPVTVRWNVNKGTAAYEIVAAGSASRSMTGEGSLQLTNGQGAGLAIRLVSDGQTPREFALAQNYPNPFNPSTTIAYDLPKDAHVRLTVYNTLGQEIATLVNDTQKAGHRTITWTGAAVASGVYYYRIQAGDFVATKKLMLVK